VCQFIASLAVVLSAIFAEDSSWFIAEFTHGQVKRSLQLPDIDPALYNMSQNNIICIVDNVFHFEDSRI